MQFFLSRHCEENCTCTDNTTPLGTLQFEANTPLLILERKRIQSFEVNRELCVIFVSEDILYRNVRFLRIAEK